VVRSREIGRRLLPLKWLFCKEMETITIFSKLATNLVRNRALHGIMEPGNPLGTEKHLGNPGERGTLGKGEPWGTLVHKIPADLPTCWYIAF